LRHGTAKEKGDDPEKGDEVEKFYELYKAPALHATDKQNIDQIMGTDP